MTVAINGRFLLNSYGGVRRFGIELTEHLAALRRDVVLVAPPAADAHSIDGVAMTTFGRFEGPVWEQVELPRWLRANGRPLLLNFASIAPILYPHQVTILHDISPALRPQDFTLGFRVQWQAAVRLGMLRRGRTLVTGSHTSQREISEHFRIDEDRVRVVYDGADSLTAVRTLPQTSVPPYVLAFGRHGAAKNSRAILDALRLFPDTLPLSVTMVGNLDPELAPHADSIGLPSERVRWMGPVTDEELASAYRGALAFIWPSLHEGFGIPPLEAQSLGTPVIASDIPINREILGDSALYFSPTAPVELAARMTELASNPQLHTDLRARGLRNADRFTWENTTLGWNRLIEERLR